MNSGCLLYTSSTKNDNYIESDRQTHLIIKNIYTKIVLSQIKHIGQVFQSLREITPTNTFLIVT